MQTITKNEARKLILHGLGLLRPPASKTDAYSLVRELGYVQLDSINVLERAHHLTLGARWDGYRPTHLRDSFEKDRNLFEEWTHDACLIPMEFEPHWDARRQRFQESSFANKWWSGRMGANASDIQRRLLKRLEQEGPLPTRAFREKGRKRGSWWGWTPEKCGLEYAWRIGLLAVSRRDGFEKVYDLAERVLPQVKSRPDREATIAWSCQQAMTRLGVASTNEIAAFWHFFKGKEIEPWCRDNLPQVSVDGETLWARPDMTAVLAKAPAAPNRLRLLCPFDPLVRDRARLERLFNFSYRFEAFVPKQKRQYGYYVLPILKGEVLVGRLNAKLHRKVQTLEVLGCWWEPGQRPKLTALNQELQRLAKRIGATKIQH